MEEGSASLKEFLLVVAVPILFVSSFIKRHSIVLASSNSSSCQLVHDPDAQPDECRVVVVAWSCRRPRISIGSFRETSLRLPWRVAPSALTLLTRRQHLIAFTYTMAHSPRERTVSWAVLPRRLRS